MANYRLTLCYDGTRWKGWQKQGNTEQTIQGKLEALLTRLLDQPVEVAGSGRTDAGAHAKMQVASFRAKTDLEPEEILAGLRRYLPADIGAISLEQVEPRFHARLSCTGKTYVYRIWNSELPNVLSGTTSTTSRSPWTWQPCAWPPKICAAPTTSGPSAP